MSIQPQMSAVGPLASGQADVVSPTRSVPPSKKAQTESAKSPLDSPLQKNAIWIAPFMAGPPTSTEDAPRVAAPQIIPNKNSKSPQAATPPFVVSPPPVGAEPEEA